MPGRFQPFGFRGSFGPQQVVPALGKPRFGGCPKHRTIGSLCWLLLEEQYSRNHRSISISPREKRREYRCGMDSLWLCAARTARSMIPTRRDPLLTKLIVFGVGCFSGYSIHLGFKGNPRDNLDFFESLAFLASFRILGMKFNCRPLGGQRGYIATSHFAGVRTIGIHQPGNQPRRYLPSRSSGPESEKAEVTLTGAAPCQVRSWMADVLWEAGREVKKRRQDSRRISRPVSFEPRKKRAVQRRRFK